MVKLIAEIGINHNGDVEIAKKLIDIASIAGFDYVKFQKRTPEVCVPEDYKNILKQTPWGEMTYLEYKHKLEFWESDYRIIDEYCKSKNIGWFVSVWDRVSVKFMKANFPEIEIIKIPSAKINDIVLCELARSCFKTLMISTGMSTEKEIEFCIEKSNPDIIFHTNSAYPTPIEEMNMGYIKWLKSKYPDKKIGYSGHEHGLSTTYPVVTEVDYIERHVTLDHDMWGSDQKASLDAVGMIKFVKAIRDIEKAYGSGNEERKVFESEKSKLKSLRGV